jgi:hypothetical protein
MLALCFFPACSQSSSTPTDTPKAAIIDQLYSLQPNEAFTSHVTQELEDYGFEVDIYKGDAVTVNLPDFLHFRKLACFGNYSGGCNIYEATQGLRLSRLRLAMTMREGRGQAPTLR